MERGWYRGQPSAPNDAIRLPKRLARAENAGASQTGVTTVVDLTGLSIDFAVTIYKVKVRLWMPAVYGSAAGGVVQINLTDAALDIKQFGLFTATGASYFGQILVEEEITVPGVYSRKGRILLNSGTGTVNTFMDPDSTGYIEAVEFED